MTPNNTIPPELTARLGEITKREKDRAAGRCSNP